ncbi:MAG: hypothetical protein Q9209_007426 [Squamulea sp. 1 TL-2023]
MEPPGRISKPSIYREDQQIMSKTSQSSRDRLPSPPMLIQIRYSMLKRHTLQVPPDAPSCCAPGTDSRVQNSRTTNHTSRTSNDCTDLLHLFGNGVDFEFDMPQPPNEDHDQSYPFRSLHGSEHMHSFEADVLSHNLDTNLLNHGLLPGTLDPGSAIDQMTIDSNHVYNLENYDFQMDDALADQLPYTSSSEPPSSNTANTTHNKKVNDGDPSSATRPPARGSHQHKPSSAEWPTSFPEPNPMQQPQQNQQQYQQQTPAPTPTSSESYSNPSTPTWQTTIRFSGADPTTVSTVIGVLAKSQAKFIYETH